LSREAGASVGSGLHKQRLFALVNEQYAAHSREAAADGVAEAARAGGTGPVGDSTPSASSAASGESTQEQLSTSTPRGTPVALAEVRATTAVGDATPTVQPPREGVLAGPSAIAAGDTTAPSPNAAASLAPLLLALVAMTAHLPRQLLVSDAERVLPLVIRAIEVAAAGTSELALAPLQQAVAFSALQSLSTLTAAAPALVSVHVHHLVALLLVLARFNPKQPTQALLRVSAINALRAFTALPYHRLHPVRQAVVAGLVAALDDPKRAVRRRAGAARNEWLTFKA
jgi:hypothetical protein